MPSPLARLYSASAARRRLTPDWSALPPALIAQSSSHFRYATFHLQSTPLRVLQHHDRSHRNLRDTSARDQWRTARRIANRGCSWADSSRHC
ncbi:hypothetical protein IG631_11639 [Alternaria alternata]|nr:hypothetical protein IG631_11639 [Alternaria alternata]